MISAPIERSPSLEQASKVFFDEIGFWIRSCVAEYGGAPPTDGHDQGTYTTSWDGWIRASGDSRPLEFMKRLRDDIRAHFSASGRWRHGYWRKQEAHHGTEHFELFLGTLWRLDPSDGETIGQLLDAAEHLGNWVEGVPEWFDWSSGLFKSFFFGTAEVDAEGSKAINAPDHFRCVNIALLAHGAGGGESYLELARLHAGRWAEAILASETPPAGLGPDGAIEGFGGEEKPGRVPYGDRVGQARLDTAIDRAENFLASGAIDALLELWARTGEERFRAAAERLLDVVATQLGDPDAGAAADSLCEYRRRTGSARYDGALREAAAALDPWAARELSLDPGRTPGIRRTGIGKRADQPLWLEDGQPRRANPITLACAAEVGGDERLAAAALDLGRTYLRLARQAFEHGRRHGCSAQTVSAVARGHGRENNAGVATACHARIARAFGL